MNDETTDLGYCDVCELANVPGEAPGPAVLSGHLPGGWSVDVCEAHAGRLAEEA